jgi:branched-chain amino acid transport system permease protein
MKDAIAFLILGLGAGAFFAMLASGIVLAFRGSGVINFAQGAIAMFVAFEFYSIRKRGMLVMPWVDVLPTKWLNLPVKIELAKPVDGLPGEVGLWPSFFLALLMAMFLGALIHYLVFRPLRNAAPLGKVIGSLGLMLYLQGIALKNFGTENPQPVVVLPKGLYRNFLGLGKPMSQESFWLAVVAIVVGALLWLVYRFTRFGLATRAAAGNEKGAVLLGYSPDRLALSNWIVSTLVAGLAGILVGSITGAMNPVKFTTLVVAALGAALMGRLSSIPIAVAGGIGIGMLQTFTTTWLPTNKWFPLWLQLPSRDALPLIVIVAVLVLRGKALPIRGTVEEKKLPLAPYPKRVWQHCLIWGSIAIFAGFRFTGTKWGLPLTTSLIASMIMLSYVVLTGYVGQISLGQMSIAGVAAFLMARLMADGKVSPLQPFPVRGLSLPWPIAAVIGIVAAIIVGVLLGLPALRIRGVQLAVVTIAAAVSLQTLYFENEKLTDLQAGSNATVRDPTIFGVNVGSVGKSGLNDNPRFVIFCVIALCLMCIGVANLRRSGTGRRLLAVRANERAAAAAGVNVMRTKLLAFSVASAIAGIGGVMSAFQQVSISSANWVFQFSLAILAFAYLGGITSINGAIVGGLLFANGLVTVLGNHHYSGLLSYTTIIGGAAMIFTAIRNPAGIAPTIQPLLQYFGNWLKTARGPQWIKALKRVFPGALIASVPVIALLWAKATEFRNWFLLMVPLLALFIRGVGLQIFGSIKASMAKRKGVPIEASQSVTSNVLAGEAI